MPNAVTYRLPDWGVTNTTRTQAVFVQDSWTRGRLTLQGALRYDHASSLSPAESNGTARSSRFNPTPVTFDRTPGVDAYNDIPPRIGVAYDLFGTGKTAIKFNWGHYLGAATNDAPYNSNNPASTAKVVTLITNSGWSDTNNNKVVDCDLMNFGLQSAVDTCAALTGNPLNFGKTGNNVTQIDPRVLSGWGTRANDYGASTCSRRSSRAYRLMSATTAGGPMARG